MKLEALAKKFNYKCVYCRQLLRPEEMSRDHVIPISKWRKERTNPPEIVLACNMCNAIKGDKNLHLFLRQVKRRRKYDL